MTIVEIVRQGFYYARTCRSLWLFGFFVGIASGGSNGGGGGWRWRRPRRWRSGAGSGFLNLSVTEIALSLVVIILADRCTGFVMRFIGEGALIEGVVRARQGGTMTMREGFRAGWAHWGVLVRIALLYFAATIGSVVAARGAVCDRAADARPARRRPARHSRRSSSPCHGSSRCISCRRSHGGSPCSRTGMRSTRSTKRGSSCTAG